MVEKKGCQNYSDDDDDDPFDIRKISDVSSDEENLVSDSCSDSLVSEIICPKGRKLELPMMEKPATEVSAIQKKTLEGPIRETVEEPTTIVEGEQELPMMEKPATEVSTIQKTTLKGPIRDRPTVEEPRTVVEGEQKLPMMERPAIEVSTIQKTTLEGPIRERPTVEELRTVVEGEQELPMMEKPAIEVSTIQKTTLEGPIRERPTVEEPRTVVEGENTLAGPQRNTSSNKPTTKERPDRMCIFCKKLIGGGKLKRHIKTHRKTHPEVDKILQKPMKEQNMWIESKRVDGMYEYNVTNLDKLDDIELMRERKPKTEDHVRVCFGCHRFISNRTFYKHKEVCGENCCPIKKESLQPLNLHKDSEFVLDILNKFRDGEVGNLIRENKIIQIIGYKHYVSRKSESSKLSEVRREIMMEMREIARLFLCFQSIMEDEVTVEDMYRRENLSSLKDAMNKLCVSENEDHIKHGLKMNLNAVFQRSIKTLIGYYAESCQDEKLKELRKFQEAYKYNLNEILSEARYHTEKNSLRKARLPKNLPIQQEITKLGVFIQSEILRICDSFCLQDYTWLRSLVVSRITLYNARRGEEGSRLLLEEWHDAVKGVWIPPEKIESIEDNAERYLVGQFKLAYLAGKGRKYVPVLIPKDLVKPIEILISNRSNFGIDEDNIFVFATKSSRSHCSGWHAVASVSEEAGVKSVNATKTRHRASTVYASLDMSEADRKIFYEHMGHEEQINKENYQCPPGLREISVMGKFLNTLEDGVKSVSEESTSSVLQVNPSPTTVLMSRNPMREVGIANNGEANNKEASVEGASNEDCRGTNKENSRRVNRRGSFRWTDENTNKIREDFREWIQTGTGNRLPCKKDLEDYLQRKDFGCTLLQLRTKIMNEQNKRKRTISERLKKLQTV